MKVAFLSCQCVHFCMQEVGPKSLRRTQWGYLWSVYLYQSSSCSGSESLETATPLQPVSFRPVCETRRRGVWYCVSVSVLKLKLKPGGGWGGVRWIGRQVCCSALPTTGASHHALHALSQNSLWPWVWRQISHTLANSNKFFCEFSTITIFLLLQFHIETFYTDVLTFTACEELW